MKQAIGIIPARYESKRFPGKPLAMIQGKPLIQWVWESLGKCKLLSGIAIAADSKFCSKVNFKLPTPLIFITTNEPNCGTERVAEVVEDHYEGHIIINIQCDEIKFEPEIIDSLVSLLQDDSIQMATIAHVNRNMDLNQDENVVKIGIDEQGNATWFSRSPIPYMQNDFFLQHIGIYGYQRDFLLKYKDLPDCPEERTEGLEQLRALRAGVKIKVIESASATLSINIPADVERIGELK
jgi:3-deoxy-manno-octulosonate cytidylyltransferase (CMP-KDO synthetase)